MNFEPLGRAGSAEVHTWHKDAALEKAMKHLGLFTNDNSQPVPTVAVGKLTVGLDFGKVLARAGGTTGESSKK